MNRRSFLKKTAPFLALPVVYNGSRVHAIAQSMLPPNLVNSMIHSDRVLVIIRLDGGNDGINTVISRDQYSQYNALRANIAIPENSVLPLTSATGLHPAMTRLQELYDDSKLSVIQGVGYPSSNFSHFRATDIWNTASNSSEVLSTGWLGRFLENEFSGYPTGFPNNTMPDPLAIQIGSVVSLMLQGTDDTVGLAIQDPNTFFSLVSGTDTTNFTALPNNLYGNHVNYIRTVQLMSQSYAGRIKTASDLAPNRYTYPSTSLSNQLKVVARLIAGGLKTRIYVVTTGGFDTHADQVVAGNTATGAHANLLRGIAEGIHAFQNDLKMYGVEDRVMGMTFTEFGRRAASNASLGTDHGTSTPMFLFGSRLSGGVVGNNPNLSDLTGGNLKMIFDFRQIYTTLLASWFGVGQIDMSEVMLRNFAVLPIFGKAQSLAMEIMKRHTLSRGQSFTYQIQSQNDGNIGASALITVVDDVASPSVQSTITSDESGNASYTVTVPTDKPDGKYLVYFYMPNGFFTAVEVDVR